MLGQRVIGRIGDIEPELLGGESWSGLLGTCQCCWRLGYQLLLSDGEPGRFFISWS
mgnify:CR=1 FL=1